jgi:hypothetical protein
LLAAARVATVVYVLEVWLSTRSPSSRPGVGVCAGCAAESAARPVLFTSN